MNTCLLVFALLAPAADPLPSWADTPTKKTIVDFVTRVTTEGGPDFVPKAERIATFDNDGTLWCEQPNYAQAFFMADRAKKLAAADPKLLQNPAVKAIVDGDREALAKLGEHGIAEVVAVTHAGMTVPAFNAIAKEWLATAKNPKLGHLFAECVYQPQLELLAYLRANGFKTFIVSGGGVDFMRGYTEQMYGIPPEQVIGSSLKTKFELRDGKAELVRLPAIGSIDDKGGKPENIELHIGRKPILAFGNSDGDLAMLQYTDTGSRPRLMLLLHHDDAEREFAYDRKSLVGRLDKALDEAGRRGWSVVSMKNDFAKVFPFDK